MRWGDGQAPCPKSQKCVHILDTDKERSALYCGCNGLLGQGYGQG